MKKEAKLFEYDELFAMCYLCAAQAIIIAVSDEFGNDPSTGRKMIEDGIKETIATRWDDPEKTNG